MWDSWIILVLEPFRFFLKVFECKVAFGKESDQALNADKCLHAFLIVTLKQLLWVCLYYYNGFKKKKTQTTKRHLLVLDLLLNSWKSAL